MTKKGTATSSKNLILGALAGGIIGAGAALLIAPKSGKELRKDVFHHNGEFGHTFSKLRDNVLHAGENLLHTASKTTEKLRSARPSGEMMAGGLALGLVGAAAAILAYAHYRHHSTDSEGFFPKDISSKASKWVKSAKDVLETIENTLEQRIEDAEESVDESSGIHKVLEFANLGVRLFQSLKQRR